MKVVHQDFDMPVAADIIGLEEPAFTATPDGRLLAPAPVRTSQATSWTCQLLVYLDTWQVPLKAPCRWLHLVRRSIQ